jgi:hypothetical protein
LAEVIQLQPATLMAGPSTSNDGSVFPSGNTIIPLDLIPVQKPYVVSTGRQLPTVQSSGGFTALSGVGAGQSVTQAHTVYVRTQSPFMFRVTYLGDAVPKVRYTSGLWIEEVDPTHPVTLLEVQGTGQVEYLCVGNQ